MSHNALVHRKQGGAELVVASGGKITVESGGEIELGSGAIFDRDAATFAAGIGVTAGVGTLFKAAVEKVGTLFKTTILIDLTGLASSTTDLDVIGVAGGGCHLGQITAAQNGTILGIRMTCLELPAGGADDIDLYSADESTLAFDSAISAATGEVALITSGAAWASGTTKGSTDVPVANQYLYLLGGEAGTAATYTAGKFLIELFGY